MKDGSLIVVVVVTMSCKVVDRGCGSVRSICVWLAPISSTGERLLTVNIGDRKVKGKLTDFFGNVSYSKFKGNNLLEN